MHSIALLMFIEVLIRWVQLPRLARLLEVRLDLGPTMDRPERLRLGELPPRARRQVRIATRVVDAWPLGQGPCLRRSLVIGHLLRHESAAVRLGVPSVGPMLEAHAWVEINGRPLEDVTRFAAFQSDVVEVPA